MRDINLEKKVLNILINKNEQYENHDQSIINKYFKKYTGVFPPEYNARPFNKREIIKFNDKLGKLYKTFNYSEFEENKVNIIS